MDLNDAEAVALQMMHQHGLLKAGWDFKYDRATKRLGATHFRTRLITLSKPMVLATAEREVRQVILHEIAHALLPPQVQHGREWKQLAAKIGYDGARTGANRALDFTGKLDPYYRDKAKQHTAFMKELNKQSKGR